MVNLENGFMGAIKRYFKGINNVSRDRENLSCTASQIKKKKNRKGNGKALLHFLVFALMTVGICANLFTTKVEAYVFKDTITGPYIITEGGVYLVTGNYSSTTGSGSDGIRVETEEPVTLVLRNANFSTGGPNNANGYYSPLVIGTTTPGGSTKMLPLIRADVTIIMEAGTKNSFISTSAVTSAQYGKTAGINVNVGSKLTIRSEPGVPGELTAIGGQFAAGIGAGPNQQAGTIIIESGIIDAQSYPSNLGGPDGSSNGAGIGGGGGRTGAGGSADGIIIRGTAIVHATSHGHGAGIGGAGGGNNTHNGNIGPGNGANVEIYGNAEVYAKSEGKGAGIGGGGRAVDSDTSSIPAGSGGTVHIYGNAYVEASSLGDGAGIGGAGASGNKSAGNGGTLLIEGNTTVIASSGGTGSGIGGGGAGVAGNAGDGGIITIRDNANVTGNSGAKGAGIGGGGAISTGKAGGSGIIVISGNAYVVGESSGCGAGIGGGGSDAGGTPGKVDFIHIYGGDEKRPIEDAKSGPTVITHSVAGTDLGAGRKGANGPKGDGDNIVITSGSVLAWDSDIVRSGTQFSNNTELVMAQAKNREPDEVIIWPINSETYGDVPGIGNYNYVAIASEDDPDNPGKKIAYLWVPYAYSVNYVPGDAASGTTTGQMPLDYDYLIYNDLATVLGQGTFRWPGYRFLGWVNEETGVFYSPGDTFHVKKSVTLVAQWEETFKITYNAGGGTGPIPVDNKEYIDGESAVIMGSSTLTAPAGMYFVGWTSSVVGDDTIYQEGNIFDITKIEGNVTMTAQWATTVYEVTYVSDGSELSGNAPDSATYASGAKVTVLGNVNASPLEKDDYVVYGWKNTATNTIYKAGDTFVITSDVELEVVWGYSVEYVGGLVNSGVAPIDSATPYQLNDTVIVLGLNASTYPLDKVGYTFVGWTPDGGTTIYKPTNTFVITENTILTAVWEADEYQITYQKEGSETGDVPSDSKRYGYGEEVTVLGNDGSPALDKAGYEFVGWTPDGGTTIYRPGKKIAITEENNVLTAVWRIYYTVTFDTDGGSTINQEKVVQGGQIAKPLDPTKDGYTFDGWYLDSTFTNPCNIDNFIVTQDETLYAKWVPEIYRVVYESGGATGSVPTDILPYAWGSPVLVKDKGSMNHPQGLQFVGWYDGKGHLYSPGETFDIKSNTTLTAIWEPTFTVQFDVNGGVLVAPDQVVPNYGLVNNPSTPTKEGYDFVGWYTGDGTAGDWGSEWNFSFDVVSKSNTVGNILVLTAQWEIKEYKVTYMSGGATSGSVPGEANHEYQSSVSVPGVGTLEKEGYTFKGWSPDGGATTYLETETFTMPASNVVLTAQWEAIVVVTHNIVIITDPIGGGNPATSTGVTKAASGTVITLVPNEVPGYAFVSWEVVSPKTVVISGNQFTMPDEDIEIIAHYRVTPIVTHNIVITADPVAGGNPATLTGVTVAASGTVVTLVPNEVPGYTFDGWEVVSPKTVVISGNQFTMPDEDIEIIAHYSVTPIVTHNIVVTADPVGGGNPATLTGVTVAASGTVITLVPNEVPGYTFDGWEVVNPKTVVISGNQFTMPDEDIEIIAHYIVTPPNVHNIVITADPIAGGNPATLTGVTSVVSGTVVTLVPNEVPGYTFDGWEVVSPKTVVISGNQFTMPDEDIEIIAHYSVTPVAMHNIVITADPLSGGNPSTLTKITTAAGGTVITLVPNEIPGYTFAGWEVVSPKTVVISGNQFTMPDEDIEIIAHYRPIIGKYKVIYTCSVGGTAPIDSKLYSVGETAKVLGKGALVYNGYTFIGWKDSVTGTVYSEGDTIVMSANDVILIAQWRKDSLPVAPHDTPKTGNAENIMENMTTLLISLGAIMMLAVRSKEEEQC